MSRTFASAVGRARLRISTALLNNRSRRRSSLGRLATGLVCLVAGIGIAASALTSHGSDLRPARNTDLIGLLRAEADRNRALTSQVSERREEVDDLTKTQQPVDLTADLDAASQQAMTSPVTGPGYTVVLDDAPDSVVDDTIDQDLLVVHQQDIQAVANALWRGGAEAMTIQGQRVVSTTGIKCVGNTVVLHGVPYAPPYRITAIGDPDRLRDAVERDPRVGIYREYVSTYGLGYDTRTETSVQMPAFSGSTDLTAARPVS